MKHLNEEQLSAMLDEALEPRARADADAHLEGCDACRAALAELAAQEGALATVLTHDPGDAYFEQFAGRVEQRIRASGAAIEPQPVREPAKGGGLFGWLRPGRFAWVGAAAALVVGAGIVFMVNREVGEPTLQDSALRQRIDQVAEREAADLEDRVVGSTERDVAPGDAPGGTARGELEEAAPPAAAAPQSQAFEDADEARSTTPATEGRAGAAGRMKEAYRNEDGEELPVPDQGEGSFASPPQELVRGQAPIKKRAGALTNQAKQEAEKQADAVPAPSEVNGKNTAADRRVSEQAKVRSQVAPQASEPQSDDERQVAKPQSLEAGESKVKRVLEESKALTAKSLAVPEIAGESRPTTSTLAGAEDSVGKAAKSSIRGGRKAVAPQRTDAVGKLETASTVRVCGTIRDHAGRPIRGARVALAQQGRSTVTDRAGKYCLDAPSGDQSLAVFAVGFQSAHHRITVGGTALKEDFTLEAVTVLELGRKLRGEYEAWPDSARDLARRAQGRAALAARARSATLYDQAAEDWERALRATRGGAPEQAARFAVAETRFRAWEVSATAQRRQAAHAALAAYLAKAPQGPDREAAAGWIERVKP